MFHAKWDLDITMNHRIISQRASKKVYSAGKTLRNLNPYFHVYRGISMTWRKIAAAALLSMIVFSYYLVLSNRPVIEHLKETNNFLYALTSTVIMLTLGFSIGLTWSLIGNQEGSKNSRVKEEESER